MRVAVLCPGPSLIDFARAGERFDLYIGVNRAVFHTRCDWWAAGDLPFIRAYRDKLSYQPGIFTTGETARELGEGAITKEHIAGRYAFSPAPPRVPWSCYSSTSALVLAAFFGATQIDLYGADLKGDRDWDQHRYQIEGLSEAQAIAERSPHRWEHELQLLRLTSAMLFDEGVSVRRHLPGGVVEHRHHGHG